MRAEELQPGRLPPVCVKRGVIATDWQGMRFTTTPRWLALLLLAGFVPFLIAYVMTRLRVAGSLPMSAEALQAFRQLRRRTLALSGLGLVLLVAALLVLPVAIPQSQTATLAIALLALLCLAGAMGLQLVVGPGVTVGATVFADPRGA